MKISGKYIKLGIFIITLFLSSSLISQGLPARISNISGEVIMKRAVYTEAEYAAINLPVEPGDSINVKSGYVNIDVEDGSVIRINDNSFCKFLLVGKSTDNNEIATRLYAYSGSYELFPAPDLNNEKSYIDLETNTGIVTAFPDGVLKVEVYEDGSLIIDVISGSGAYKTPIEEKMIYAGDIVEINPSGVGSIAHREVPTSSTTSRYQNSNQINDEYSSPSRAYIPKKLYSSSRTLDDNGTWVYVSSYGYCWKPRTVIVEWKPYTYGQWIWTSRWGYIWVSSEPWCWTTYHYGYWVWSKYHGWIWMPGSTWCNSRVVWSWGIGWVGWFPYPPYYSWWHWYPYSWWCCATWNSFYTPRYRYHNPRYGYIGDKPTYSYERITPSERIVARNEETPGGPIFAVKPEITELDRGLTNASRISETDINARSEIQPTRRPVSTEDNTRRIEEVSNSRTNPVNQNSRNRQENDYSPTITAPRPNTQTTSRSVNTRTTPPRTNDTNSNTRTNPPTNNNQNNTRTNPPTNNNQNNTRTNPPTNNNQNNTRTNPPTNNNQNNTRTNTPTNNNQNNTRTNPPTNNNQNNTRTNTPTNNNQNNTRTNPPTNNNQNNTRTNPPTNNNQNNTRTNPPTNNNQNNTRTNPPQRNNPPVNNNPNEEEDRNNTNPRPSRERRP